MNQSTKHVTVLPIGGLLVVVGSLATGFLAGNLVGLGYTALISGILAATVAYSSYGSAIGPAFARSLIFGAFFLLLGVCVVLSTGIPWLAALAMAFFAFASSVLTSTSPLGTTAALLSSTVYIMLAGFSLLFMRDQEVNTLRMLLSLALGTVVGILVTAVVSFGLSRLPSKTHSPTIQRVGIIPLWRNLLASVSEFRRAPRDGVRRAIALGVAMYLFQSVPSHDGFLLIITTAIVLPVYGRVALMTVGSRLLWSLMAIGVALILPFILPRPVVTVVAILVLCYAITTALRSTTNSLAATCIGFLLLIGAPGAEIGIYAGWRLIDVAGGFVIAWLCGYILWPNQPLRITPIPYDLHRQCESVRPAIHG